MAARRPTTPIGGVESGYAYTGHRNVSLPRPLPRVLTPQLHRAPTPLVGHATRAATPNRSLARPPATARPLSRSGSIPRPLGPRTPSPGARPASASGNASAPVRAPATQRDVMPPPGMEMFVLRPLSSAGRIVQTTYRHIVYPCSGASAPRGSLSSAEQSPINRYYSLLLSDSSDFTSGAVQLLHCFESLATRIPLSDTLVATSPDYVQLHASILASLLPLASVWLSSLRSLLVLSDLIWRLAGGLLSGKSQTGMSAVVFGPDPEGGSRQVQTLEILNPVSEAGLIEASGRVKVSKELWRKIAAGGEGLKKWIEGAGGKMDECVRRVEAGRLRQTVSTSVLIATLTNIATSPTLSALPARVASALASMTSVTCTREWYNDIEALTTYWNYRDVHAQAQNNLTLLEQAVELWHRALDEGGDWMRVVHPRILAASVPPKTGRAQDAGQLPSTNQALEEELRKFELSNGAARPPSRGGTTRSLSRGGIARPPSGPGARPPFAGAGARPPSRGLGRYGH